MLEIIISKIVLGFCFLENYARSGAIKNSKVQTHMARILRFVLFLNLKDVFLHD